MVSFGFNLRLDSIHLRLRLLHDKRILSFELLLVFWSVHHVIQPKLSLDLVERLAFEFRSDKGTAQFKDGRDVEVVGSHEQIRDLVNIELAIGL